MEVAPSVYVVEHRLVDGKNAIVFGRRGALAEYARLVGDRLPQEPHGMFRRHRLVVSKIIEEVTEERRPREGQDGA